MILAAKSFIPASHVVDILGSTKGRDQPIMLVGKALQLVGCISRSAFVHPDVIILDPFCKAGEILLAAALRSCMINKGRSKPLVSSHQIFKQMYGGRYYALAPDERHYLLSLRTFYGNDRSHDKSVTKPIQNGNYLSEVDGQLNSDKFKRELKGMIKFIRATKPHCKIVAVGNPPYQESDGGFGGSASAIYNHFVESLMDTQDIAEFAVVIPSRWFSAGKGTEEFRKKVLACKQIKSIRHFTQSKEVFPTVDVLGGVCFFHFKRDHNGPTTFIGNGATCHIDLSRLDIIPDDPKAYALVEKIKSQWQRKFVSDTAWPGKPFGIRTFYFKRNGGASASHKHRVPCMSKGRKIRYVKRSEILKNKDKIDLYKVAVPAAYAPGSKMGVRRVTLPVKQYFIIAKGTIAAETYNIVGAFKAKNEAENFRAYLQTDFARYLLGLRKVTQHIPMDRWQWVPFMDTTRVWTDDALFDFFKLTKQEREHIRQKVMEWS